MIIMKNLSRNESALSKTCYYIFIIAILWNSLWLLIIILYYIFNGQGTSYEAPLRVSGLGHKNSRDDRNYKMHITSFLIGEWMALFNLVILKKGSLAFVPCVEIITSSA